MAGEKPDGEKYLDEHGLVSETPIKITPPVLKGIMSDLEKKINEHKQIAGGLRIIYLQAERKAARMYGIALARVLKMNYAPLPPLCVKESGYYAPVSLVMKGGMLVHVESIESLKTNDESKFKSMMQEFLLHFDIVTELNDAAAGQNAPSILYLSGMMQYKAFGLPDYALCLEPDARAVKMSTVDASFFPQQKTGGPGDEQ